MTGSDPDSSNNADWATGALDDVDAHTPTTGHNVVGVNAFTAPDESPLYLVSHHENQSDAEIARVNNQARTGDTTHIYSARAPAENDEKTATSYMENEA